MLSCEGKRRIFEEVVEEDEEFTEDGGEGEFGGFASVAETLVKGAEDGIEADRAECGHVESTAEAETASRDAALAAKLSAIVVERSDAEESAGLAAGKGSQLRAKSQNGDGAQGAHAIDLSEALEGSGEGLLFGEGFGHGLLEFEDVFGEEGDASFSEGLDQGHGLANLLDHESAAFEDGLLTCDDQFLKSQLSGAGHGIGLGLDEAAEVVEGLCIERIGLSPAAKTVGEVANLAWVDHRESNAGGMSGGDEGPMVRAAGFADQMDARRDPCEEAAVTGRSIGEGAAEIGAMIVELFLGEIQAEVKVGSGHEE